MTFDLVPHLKVAGITATDDWIKKRSASIRFLAGMFRKRAAVTAVATAADVIGLLASGCKTMPETFKSEVFDAMRRGAPSYVPAKNADAELGLYALLAAVVAISEVDDATLANVLTFAAAIASGASFLGSSKKTQIETLRQELVQRAGDLLERQSRKARVRSPLSSATMAAPKQDEDPAAYLARVPAQVNAALNALTRNARLDREELDILWWAMNGRSGLTYERFEEQEAAIASVGSGLEIAAYLAFTPPGDAHRAIAERALTQPDVELALDAILAAISNQGDGLRRVVSAGRANVEAHPTVFPLLFGLFGAVGGDLRARLRVAAIDHARSLSLRQWCHRAFDEASLVRRLGHSLELPMPART